MQPKSAENWLSLSGIIAGLFYFLHIIIGTRQYPGYDRMSQAVSDLTATDAPSFLVASRLSTIYGALACLCCTVIFLQLRSEHPLFRRGMLFFMLMHWISFIGYTLFPLSGQGFQGTVQDIFHFYIVTISVVLLSIISLTMLYVGSRKGTEHRWLGKAAIIALVIMFVGSIGTGIVPAAYFGLMERLSTFSVVVFTGIVGYFGFNYQTNTT
ncbi:MAG TPA: DUF998 domain-containing protein [bacterium]|nr:DUF998 domain-containing protein [bacterium]